MLALEPTPSGIRSQGYHLLLRQIESHSVRCGVVGLGFIGSVLADALLNAGFTTRGYDRAPSAVARFSHARNPMSPSVGSLYACDSDPAVLQDCRVIFIAVRNMVDDGVVNEEPLHAAARLIRTHSRPCLVILESTVTPGTTRRFAQALGQSDDDCLFVAHAPERLSAGQNHDDLRSIPHLVGGLDAMSTQLARAMLAQICDLVIPVAEPEVSELSKLLENAFLSVNIALTSEITRLCAGAGVRAQDVCRAAATKPKGFMSFYPGPGLGGHCLPNDLVLLAESARSQGWEPELLRGAIAVNDRAPELVVTRLNMLLLRKGSTLVGASVLLVGVGFKIGSSDVTRSPAIEVARVLLERGASIAYADRLIERFEVNGKAVIRMTAEDVKLQSFTAAILLSGDVSLDVATLVDRCGVVLDAGGSGRDRTAGAGLETL